MMMYYEKSNPVFYKILDAEYCSYGNKAEEANGKVG